MVSTSIISKANLVMKCEGIWSIKTPAFLILVDIQNMPVGSPIEGKIPPGKWTMSFIPVYISLKPI